MKSPIAMAAKMALAAALAALIAQPAAAQPPAAAPKPAAAKPAKDAKAPMDVTADHMETHNAECIAIFTGSAEALQDTKRVQSRLRADVLTAHMEVKKDKPASTSPGAAASSSCGEMTTLEAKGNVYYASSDGRRVHGDNGFYDAATTTVTITGDVTAVDGQNVMRGTKMVYNTDTGEGHVEGGGKGPTAKNRPRGVFYPKDSDAQADPAASPQAAKTQTDKTQADKKKKASQ